MREFTINALSFNVSECAWAIVVQLGLGAGIQRLSSRGKEKSRCQLVQEETQSTDISFPMSTLFQFIIELQDTSYLLSQIALAISLSDNLSDI